MSAEIIKIQLPKTFNPENDYCTVNKKVFVTHIDPQFNKGIGSGWLKITHNEEEWGEVVLDELFLLYDEAGLNYVHFFFNFFGKCLYFDELRISRDSAFNSKLLLPCLL
jgi:hypothetical protein